jgi:hypothetical protein
MDEELDAFTVRMDFKEMLEHLTKSQTLINDAAEYCLTHRTTHAKDLINCITEHISKAPVLERVKLLYILDSMCSQSKKRVFPEYPAIVAESLLMISKLICPDEQSGADANAPALKKVILKYADTR